MNASNVANLPATINHNRPSHTYYEDALKAAKRVGDNFGTLDKNMRLMVVDLVRAACIPDADGTVRSMQSAITAAKKAMRYDKLDPRHQKTAANNFTYARTIAGAWLDLTDKQQTAFIEGNLTPSTLHKAIKDAEKAEVASDGAQEDATEQLAARAEKVERGASPKQAAVVEDLDIAGAMGTTLAFIKSIRQQGMHMAKPEELALMKLIWDEIEGLRSDLAQPAITQAA